MTILPLLLAVTLISDPATLNETIATQERTIHELHDELILKKRALERKEREVTFLREQVIRLEGYPDTVKELTDELDRERAETLVLRTQVESYEQLFAKQRAKEEKWKADHERLVTKELHLNEAKGEISRLEEEKKSLVLERESLAKNITEMQQEIANFGELYQTVQVERQQRVVKEKKLGELENILTKQKEGLKKLEKSRSFLEGELFQTRSDYLGLLKKIKARGATGDAELTAFVLGDQKTHTVQEGETLSLIAQKHYGSSVSWPKIYEANKSVIPNKDRIRVGTTLVIPD